MRPRATLRVITLLGATLPYVLGCGGAAEQPRERGADGSGGEAASAVAGQIPRIKGVSLVAAPYAIDRGSLAPVLDVGAEWVAVVPFAFIGRDGARPSFGHGRQFSGERPEGIARAVSLAHELGLEVLLKPHLWVAGQGWPGEFEPADDAGWRAFEEGYADYILTFARLADSLGVEMMSVGTEVDRVARTRPAYWRGLIARVRDVYDGRLTYAANWDQYQAIEFWDALDLIGIDAYFPLDGAATPDVDVLMKAWGPWVEEIEALSARVDRPVLFTEWGYQDADGAAGRQWEIPSGRAARDLTPNPAAQAAAYEALFRTWWDRPRFAGGFTWKWFVPPAADYQPDVRGFDRGRRGPSVGYTPQAKPAEDVLRRWYGGATRPD